LAQAQRGGDSIPSRHRSPGMTQRVVSLSISWHPDHQGSTGQANVSTERTHCFPSIRSLPLNVTILYSSRFWSNQHASG
ncbi:hypothetical protein J4V19_26195, partial [Escherichia coli]